MRELHKLLVRYVDAAENYNDFDFESNGELFIVAQGAPHWDLVVDLGANVGRWAESVLRRNPNVTIHGFEPLPDAFRQLQSNLSGHGNVHLHNIGAGERDGVLRFYDYGTTSGGSGYYNREGSIGKTADRVIELPITALDTFVANHKIARIDYVKIDTEGAEMSVLRGMRSCLAAGMIDCLQFEYGGTWIDSGETLLRASDYLREVNFEVFRLFPDHVVPLKYLGCRDETFKYSNYIALKSRSLLETWSVAIIDHN